MSLPSKVKRTKGGDNSQNSAGKSIKPLDSNKDTTKQLDKTQPTAEQMRIAQIIETKPEDPAFKEKLKQVMDATQKSFDDAYTALHDCDNDPNRAVNLLLEECESEWSLSSKKKKNRTSSEKTAKEKEPPIIETNNEDDKWGEPTVNSKPNTTVQKGGAHPQGRARGAFRGGRAPVASTAPITSNSLQNVNNQSDRGRRNKVLNGPSNRGRSNRGRIQARGFGRGRTPFRRPSNKWEHPRNISSSFNHENNSDWDNEEYQGSLANSQIYTSSGTGNTPPSLSNSILIANSDVSPNDYDTNNQSAMDINAIKTVSNSHKPSDITSLSITYHKYPSIPDAAISPPMRVRSPTLGTNLLMLPSRSDRSPIASQEIRMPKPRPKIPPPSKIPATAVEMPPDSIENSIGLLDVQFGVMELNDNSTTESVQVTTPPPSHRSPSPATSDKLLSHQPNYMWGLLVPRLEEQVANPFSPGVSACGRVCCAGSSSQAPTLCPELNYVSTTDSLLLNDRSFSPVRNSSSNSLSQISDLTSKVSDVTSSLYQESTYQSSPYSKTSQQSPSVYCSGYSSGQATSTSSIIYSSSSSQSTYSSSSTSGVYGGISSSYPQYQYNNYPSQQQNQSLPILTNSTNSYQSVLGGQQQQYGTNSQSVYGTSGVPTPTPSYTTPYQTYNSTVQHNHKPTLLTSSSTNSKEYETTQPSVNLGSISHSAPINPTPTLLSASQTTPTSKPTSLSSMGKNAVVANMPPGVTPIVGTHQYIMGQGGIPYFQQPMYAYDDLQLMQQQRLAPHIGTGYYEMGYQASTTRDGVQYNMNDARFARAETASPVQATSISQQSGTQAHQQPMMNPTALSYYYYGGSAMIPGNFQFSAPTIYPVAAGGTSGHGSTNSGVYGKNPTNFTGNYGGTYESNQVGSNSGSATDYKSSTSSGSKVQPTQAANPSTNSDIANIYSKTLSKSYEKPNFHCATPPPFSLGSQNSGMGPAGGYPQHLFIPAMTPHHNTTTLMHQPIHQDASNSMSGRSQTGSQQPKVVITKASYTASTYWPQN